MHSRRRSDRVRIGIVAGALTVAVSVTAPARAQEAGHALASAYGPAFTVMSVIAVPDLAFNGLDLAANDPGKGWWISQTAWTAPQAALLDVAILADSDANFALVTGLGVWLDQLAVYGRCASRIRRARTGPRMDCRGPSAATSRSSRACSDRASTAASRVRTTPCSK